MSDGFAFIYIHSFISSTTFAVICSLQLMFDHIELQFITFTEYREYVNEIREAPNE